MDSYLKKVLSISKTLCWSEGHNWEEFGFLGLLSLVGIDV